MEYAKQQGKLPAGLERMFEELEPKEEKSEEKEEAEVIAPANLAESKAPEKVEKKEEIVSDKKESSPPLNLGQLVRTGYKSKNQKRKEKQKAFEIAAAANE